MLIYSSSKHRPFHLGPFPLETLPRDKGVLELEAKRPARAPTADASVAASDLARAAEHYREIFACFTEGKVALARAPLPKSLEPRVADVKGAAYFLDASQAGICRIPDGAWLNRERPAHEFAVVMLVEHGRLPEPNNLAFSWGRRAVSAVAEMRAAEISVVIAGHVRNMGFHARAHFVAHCLLDLDKLAVLAGLAVRSGGALENPYLGRAFSIAAVSTAYELVPDVPLHADALKAKKLRYWWGINGAQSGRERNRCAKRPSHLSRYAMETVKRVDRPTTLILDDEVPRVSARAAFFERALHGDLGDRAKRERHRFAFKTPFSQSFLQVIRAMVPFQDGVPGGVPSAFGDPAANTRAIKSLSYLLGSDLTGICEVPRYAWFSHKNDGTEIVPYHRYAVVMLIDQGFDTMDGASGDDWISGAQSMRAYLRGAEIAGVMAEFLRVHGHPARSHTNANSDVLHIPLVLWAGLGELSRIGELVLNPFVGPRFKSVVLTTDLALEVDRPVDFGLQYFCSHCQKCARECPCDAIPFGDKVIFNGYETWKPDVERCARYRITNPRGSACGRCMKTCPINKVVSSDGAWLTRAASWLGVHARWLKPLMVPIATRVDDVLGHGKRNPAKKWWLDHELVNAIAVTPRGTNRRDLDVSRKVNATTQKMAYYHASMMPPPDEVGPFLVDRKAALAARDLVETPAQARKRKAAGGTVPWHYIPPPIKSAQCAPAAAPAVMESSYKR